MDEFLIRISISVGIILATFIIAYLFSRFFNRLITKSTLVMQNDPTNYNFLRHLVVGVIYLLGFSLAIYAIPELRAVANSLLAGAGILAVAIGFASQAALSNIISGVFIVIFKPFRINDRIKLQAYEGIVEDITLRHTVIRNFENKRIIVPNSIISDEIVVNSDFADEKICKWLDIGISYQSNIEKAKAIMVEEVLKHPLHMDARSAEDIENGAPEVVVRVIALAESSVNLRAWTWAANSAQAFVLNCDLFESIKNRFDQEGIEIPFPHRTVYMKQAGEK